MGGRFRLEDAGFGRVGLWVFTFLILAPLAVYGALAGAFVASAAGGGVEFNAVSLWVPQNDYGQLGVLNVPLNVSSTNLLSYENVYVIDEAGKPYYSYLFSANPPLVSIIDSGISTKTYSVFYGGTNPYSSFVAVPGQTPIYAAFDDFDYNSGYWNYTGQHSISQSQLLLRNGTAFFNTSYTPDVVALWKLRSAATAYAIELLSQTNYTGWAYIHLTSSNFGDWGSIINGSDIFFTDSNGNPLNYTIAYINLQQKVLDAYVLVNLTAGKPETIMMFYGRNNPYPQYREPITAVIKGILTTAQKAPPTATDTVLQLIYGAVHSKGEGATLTLNATNVNLGPDYAVAPHLFAWWFRGEANTYINITNVKDFPSLADKTFTVAIRFNTYAPIHTIHPWNIRMLFGYAVNATLLGTAKDHLLHLGVKPSNALYLGFFSDDLLGAKINNTEWYDASFVVVYNKINNVQEIFANGTNMGSRITNGSISLPPIRVMIGNWPYPSYQNAFRGYISYITVIYGQNVSLLTPVDGVVDLGCNSVVLDPTFFNGTNYLNMNATIAGAVPKDALSNVERVPSNVTWLWVVNGASHDGLIHFRFFPAGSVIKIFANGSLIAWIRVSGTPNAAGLIPDYAFSLPAGTYNITVSIANSARNYYSHARSYLATLTNGLELYNGTGTAPITTSETAVTAYGGDMWCEYSGNGYQYVWYVPGYHVTKTDYVISTSGGYTPFAYYNDFSSTGNVKTYTYWRTITQTITVSTWKTLTLANVSIAPNDVIAPHLYDWLFNGKNAYINVDPAIIDELSATVTLGYRLHMNSQPPARAWILFFGYPATYEGIHVLYNKYINPPEHWQIGYWNDDTGSQIHYYENATNKWESQIYIYDNSTLKKALFINGVLINSSTVTAEPRHLVKKEFYIGKPVPSTENYFDGYISYVYIYPSNETQYVSEMFNHIMPSGMVFLLDPTFFNGSTYFNLINASITATPYNVIRAPAKTAWLWLIDNVTTDNYVHLRYFPNGTVVEFFNASTGALVANVTISGTPNATGLIPDYTVSLASGNYTITARIPEKEDIAPHLYNWYFDDDKVLGGTGEWLKFNGPSIPYAYNLSITISAYVMPTTYDAWDFIFMYYDATWHPFGYLYQVSHAFGVAAFNGTNLIYLISEKNLFVDYENINLTYFDVKNATGYQVIGGVLSNSSSVFRETKSTAYKYPWSGEYLLNGIRIERTDSLHHMYLHYVLVTLDNGSKTILLDPTFFNGTNYFTIGSNLIGTVVNPPLERIPAQHVWVWVLGSQITSSSQHGIHLQYFPEGTIVRVYTAGSSIPAYNFTVSGTPNAAGLIPDYVINLPDGTYEFEFIIPHDGITVSASSVSYSTARDSYALKLAVSYAAWGYGHAEAGITYSNIFYEGTEPVLVWSRRPITDTASPESRWNPTVVIESRFYVTGNDRWYVNIYNISAIPDYKETEGYSWSQPVMSLYVGDNGSVFFTYAPDGVNKSIITSPPTTWVYVRIKFVYPSIIEVGVGPGNYSNGLIYRNITIFTYNATKYAPMHVLPVIGLRLTPNTTQTMYIDWERVRVGITGTLSKPQTATLYWTETYRLQLTQSPVRLIALNVTNAEAVSVVLPSINNTFTKIAVGGNPELTGSAYAYGVVSDPGYASVLNGSTVIERNNVTTPINGEIIINYIEAEHLLQTWLVTQNSETLLLNTSVVLNNVSVAYVAVSYTSTAKAFNPLYTSSERALLNAVSNTYPTVSAFNPSGTAYSVGWFYNFTTASNTSAYVDVGVAFKTSAVELFIRTSWGGTLKALDLGKPKSPAVVAVGYDFSNVTSSIEAFAMYVWMDGNVTRYRVGYVSAYVNTTVPYMFPYVNATNSFVIVGKFAVTIGNMLKGFAKGVFRFVVKGPIPVGGMVKYTTFTQPTVIKWTGSDVEFVPQAEGHGIVLEGFRGWTLNLAVSGTSASGLTITSDDYPVDVHLGFTAMIIVDPSSRQISIIAASPPPQMVTATVTTASKVSYAVSPPPPAGAVGLSLNDAIKALLNPFLLAGAFAGVAVVAYRMTGEVGLAIAIPSAAALFIFAVMQQWQFVMVAVVALVAGLAIRVAK